MVDQAEWQRVMEAELRALGRELAVPPAADLSAAVRQRLERTPVRRRHLPGLRTGALRRWPPAWHVAVVVVAVLLAVPPQGRAVITHVLRFAGIELRQEPGPERSPASSPSLPGERRMPLEEARRQVAFALLVPAALGRPDEVVVSDHGRVGSLIYHRTPYGELRLDEFAGHLDRVYYEKYVRFGDVTEVRVNGAKGLWIKGPHDLVYITRDGVPATDSARLTTGNTLIWGTRKVALRLEGGFGKNDALAIAGSAG